MTILCCTINPTVPPQYVPIENSCSRFTFVQILDLQICKRTYKSLPPTRLYLSCSCTLKVIAPCQASGSSVPGALLNLNLHCVIKQFSAVADGCLFQDLCGVVALVLVLRGQHLQRRSTMPLDQRLCSNAVEALTQSAIAIPADPRHYYESQLLLRLLL